MEHDTINQMFEEVATHLAGNWSWKPNPADWAPGGELHEYPSGIVLYVHNAQARNNVFSIRPQAPKDDRGQVPYVASKDLPSINISHDKSPYKIARDIERRLIPLWAPIYTQALEAIARSNEYHDTSVSVATELANIARVKAPPRGERGRISFYDSPFPIFAEKTSSAEVHGDEVTIELKLAPEDAITLLKYLTNQ
jgi:hypothetical protein